MAAKLSYLNSSSNFTYRVTSEKWKAALLEAGIARDTAVDAAYVKEIKATFDAGMKASIGQKISGKRMSCFLMETRGSFTFNPQMRFEETRPKPKATEM
jgi:hypothetical protein